MSLSRIRLATLHDKVMSAEQAARFIKKRIYPDAARPPDAGNFADYAGGAAYNIRLCH